MGRKCDDTSGPFNFRGCDLAARKAPRQGACPGAIPGNRSILRPELRLGRPISNKSRTSLCGRVSKTQPAWGSTRATCQFSWGRGRKVMHLPYKLIWERYPPFSTSLRPPSNGVRRLSRRSAKYGDGQTSSHEQATTRQAIFSLRETRPKHREKPHKLLQVGVTPTPAIFKWQVASGK